MREALCFVILIVVITFGWNQPYSEHLRSLTGIGAEPTPTPASPPPRADVPPAAQPARKLGVNMVPPPTPDRNWMFDKTSMDGPRPDPNSKKGARGGR